jgi:hypothetical protein
MSRRPAGVTILAVAVAVAGALALLAAGAWFAAARGLFDAPRAAGLSRAIAVVLILFALVDGVLAYGLWSLRPWAWALGVVVEILGLVAGVFRLSRGEVIRPAVGITFAMIGLVYLLTPGVRQLFRRADRAPGGGSLPPAPGAGSTGEQPEATT